MELAALFAGLLLVGLVVLALIILVCNHPGYFLGIIAVLVLMVSCQRSEADPRFELSFVIESEDDRASAVAAIDYAAKLYANQFGIELAPVVSMVNDPAQHTHAGALLDAVKQFRFTYQMLTATDATVFFTRRTMTRGYQGVATVGPVCSASAAAVVTLRDDGYDGQILAHELLHTLGVPHDLAGGYLMSESNSRAGSDYASPDTVLTVKAAPLADCMGKPAASSYSVPTGTPTASSGGGGAFDLGFVFALLFLCGMVYAERVGRAAITRLREENADLQRMLSANVDEFSLRDIKSISVAPGSHSCILTVEFYTLSGLTGFDGWLRTRSKLAKLGGTA